MSSKWILGLMAAVLIMASATSSFAQVQLQIFNTPSPGEIQTNHHANTSDPTSTGSGILVSGSLVASSPLSTTTLTLTFPAPITSDHAGSVNGPIPPSDPIRIEGGTGVFANVTAVTTVNFTAGTVQITLPCWQGPPSGNAGVCGNTNNSDSGSFRLVGVRISAVGKTAPLNVTASISSSANNYIPPSTTTLPIINALGTWGNVSQSTVSGQNNNNTFLIFTNQVGGAFADNSATLLITEAFAAAWRTQTQSSTNNSALPNGVQIKLTFNGLPSGVTLNLAAAGPSTSPRLPSVTLTPAAVTAPTSSNPTANETIITFGGAQNPSLTSIDNILLQLTLALTGTLGTLTPGSITVTANNDPIGDALTTTAPLNVPTIAGGYPRFASDPKTVTIGAIRAANTTLLIPYAVRIASLNFETGIAIANTSADPFGAAAGGATPASGTVVVSLFPSTATGAGTASTYTSSASTRVGSGMATDGTIPAGATWAVNLTDILSRATPAITGDFSGYLFIEANFLNAHGVAYVYDGRGFTSNTPALVLPSPLVRTGNFEALNN